MDAQFQASDSSLHIREAHAEDASMIRRMVRAARLDPTSLDWRHFLIAEVEGHPVGIGQVKEYPGCQEMGSLVTLPAYRGRGVASALIEALEARAGRPLYLLCAARMEPYYQRFDYVTIPWRRAPWFLKLKLLPVLPLRLFGIRVLVMRKG